ncbi:toprim domain-containing protein [Brevibacillus sp. NRS-1366]|uniref:toprim domain-containing protein n=1 Tax=Brevibacillus sp. NRS-1366 TaxID=3233899 RepID=UPI003D1C135A
MDECVIIVEGKTDKERLLQVLAEPVTIICTYGSYSFEKGEQLVTQTQTASEIYLFTDEDFSGKKLRSCLMEDFPDAIHLHTQKMFGEVANTPLDVLAEILERAGFAVNNPNQEMG